MTEYKVIDLQEFDAKLKPFLTEVSVETLGAKVLSASDDFFASKDSLIKPYPAKSLKGQFGPNGALYDGWESRRHNPTYDWAIILLATPSTHLSHFDIDTTHFSGNECPESEVLALQLDASEIKAGASVALSAKDSRWQTILPRVTLGPSARHVFEVGSTGKEGTWSAVMVRMIPDGGMARFRAYGQPIAPTPYSSLPPITTKPINLLDPLHGAGIVTCSDANFSPPQNLLLPGRGTDMSDGWETRRSQAGRGKYAKGQPLEGKERSEWVVARFATTGSVSYVELDTAFHPGNYPFAASVQAVLSDEKLPGDEAGWVTLVAKTNLGAHRQHYFEPERAVSPNAVFSHVRLTIYPDGGLKRFRVFGHPLPRDLAAPTSAALTLRAVPLTAETFKKYGQVVQGYSVNSSAPRSVPVNIANQGTAFKFNRLARFERDATAAHPLSIGAIRSESVADVKEGAVLPVPSFERRKLTPEAYMPQSKGVTPELTALGSGGAYVSVVALNGSDDKPDLSTVKAFFGTSAQGVVYDAGVWHYHVTVDGPLDYCTVEASTADAESATVPSPLSVYVAPYTAVKPPTEKVAKQVSKVLNGVKDSFSSLLAGTSKTIVPVPLTAEAWAPYGGIVTANPELKAAQGLEIPEKKLTKYTGLSKIEQSYPEDAGAITGIGIFRATPFHYGTLKAEGGKPFDIRFLERHPYTSQSFIPLGKGEIPGQSEPALAEGGFMMLVVADNGPDDRPDPKTLKAFIMPSSIGMNYKPNVWHHPVLVVGTGLDLACIETQVATGTPDKDPRDCELLIAPDDAPFGVLAIPAI